MRFEAGHLLNRDFGGDGVLDQNLAPITRTQNARHRRFEKILRDELDNLKSRLNDLKRRLDPRDFRRVEEQSHADYEVRASQPEAEDPQPFWNLRLRARIYEPRFNEDGGIDIVQRPLFGYGNQAETRVLRFQRDPQADRLGDAQQLEQNAEAVQTAEEEEEAMELIEVEEDALIAL